MRDAPPSALSRFATRKPRNLYFSDGGFIPRAGTASRGFAHVPPAGAFSPLDGACPVSLSPPPSWSGPQTRGPARRPARRPGRQKLRWGWIEAVILAIVLCPALTFLPFLRPARILLRVANYGIGLVAWAGVLRSGRARRMPAFSGRSWAYFSTGWIVLQAFNPMGDLPLAAPAGACLEIAILSPIFWAPRISTSYGRVYQMLNILFVCSFASLAVGFLQYRYPGQMTANQKSYISGPFDPPNIQVVEMTRESGRWKDLMVTRPDGQRVFRPCGLTDAPGGATTAASNCCLIGMLWILRGGTLWKRGFAGLACLMGMVMMYYCQVRTIYLITLGGLGLLGVCLFLRRDFRALSILTTIGLAIFVAGLAWAVKNGGADVLRRFEDLVDGSGTGTYSSSRGRFLEETFGRYIWEYPLGAGMGHWGMMNMYFGHPETSLYSEIQLTAWVFDGGIPLMVGYGGAAALTLWYVFRLSLRVRDPEFGKVACTIVGMNMGILVAVISGLPFISPYGLQYWLALGATIGAAAHQPRPQSRPWARGRA